MVSQEELLRKIIQYLNDPKDTAAQKEVEELIGDSAKNKSVYEQILVIWNTDHKSNIIEQLDTEEAVSRIELKLAELKVSGPEYNKNVFGTRLKVAAAIVLMGITAYWFYNKKLSVDLLTKTTQRSIDSVMLADGSKIYLDSYSMLSYPTIFKGKIREINLLKGQAFFKIHRDAAHPFIVNINKSSVTVLGTTFNINTRDGQIALNVATGKVRFQPITGQNEEVILTAGKGMIYKMGAGNSITLVTPDVNERSWLTHELNFVDASLTEVCHQLEESYKVKITLTGDTPEKVKLNARFKDSKLIEILEVLQETYPIKIIQQKNNSIIIQNTTTN